MQASPCHRRHRLSEHLVTGYVQLIPLFVNECLRTKRGWPSKVLVRIHMPYSSYSRALACFLSERPSVSSVVCGGLPRHTMRCRAIAHFQYQPCLLELVTKIRRRNCHFKVYEESCSFNTMLIILVYQQQL